MLTQLLMGIIALGTIQATTQKQLDTIEECNFLIEVDNLAHDNPIEEITIHYADYKSNNVKYIDMAEYDHQNNVNFTLIGFNYINIAEVTLLTEMNTTIALTNANGWSPIKSGTYKIQEYEAFDEFEIINLQTDSNLREDFTMYERITEKENDKFTGWYCFDEKYTYNYTAREKIEFYWSDTELNPQAFAFSTEEESSGTGYWTFPIDEGNEAYILKNMVYMQENNWLPINKQSNNIYYLSNAYIKTTELFNFYNVYKILQPEKLKGNIVNRTYKFTEYNPFAVIPYDQFAEFATINYATQGWVALNDDYGDEIIRILNNTTFEFNNMLCSSLSAQYRSANGEWTHSNDHWWQLNDSYGYYHYTWSYTYARLINGTEVNYAVPIITQEQSGEGTRQDLSHGKVQLLSNQIYIAFAYQFNEENFKANFVNPYITQNGGEMESIFTLITQGFMSWKVLFDFKIGTIRIGTLILAPLVVGFLVWLIHLIKRG